MATSFGACPDNIQYLSRLSEQAREAKVPLSGCMDLTHRCNWRCIHCYAAGGNVAESDEMPTGRVVSLIDEIAQAGTLFLLITGGEPLCRRDFVSIYTHAKKKGLLVTVFTNATRMDERISGLFRDLPPQAVEISVYGATPETHDRITDTPGSFAACMRGLHLLLERGVNVKIKTILMTPNRHEFVALQEMARSLGVDFRVDAAIFPRLDGDKSPIQWRVRPDESVALEFADAVRARDWKQYFDRVRASPVSESLYNCGAGRDSFYVDPQGTLQPCLMAADIRFEWSEGRFEEGWRWISSAIRQKRPVPDYRCNACDRRALCGFCPGYFLLENGDDQRPSDYLCLLGKERLAKMQAMC